jgi:REP element-mobilizing transposase RayT
MSQGHNYLNHATWESKYRVVFTPKYRKKVLFGQIRHPRLHQESGDGRSAVGSVAAEARLLIRSHLLSQSPS